MRTVMRGSTSRQSPPSPWMADYYSHHHGDISYTPAGLPMQSAPFSSSMPSPFLCPGFPSDAGSAGSTASANYFGIVVDSSSNPPGSTPGPHTKKNWEALTQASSSLLSPRPQAVSSNAVQKHYLELAASNDQAMDCDTDRNQDHAINSPTSHVDVLSRSARLANFNFQNSTRRNSRQGSITIHNQAAPDDRSFSPGNTTGQHKPSNQGGIALSSFNLPRTYSPATYQSSGPNNQDAADVTSEHPRLSLPLESTRTPSSPLSGNGRRADTLPTSLGQVPVSFISPESCAELLHTAPEQTLLLDVRPYPQFSRASISNSLNLCIPTTLLKRPSFNTEKLKDTFVSESEKRKFSSWKNSSHIIVYDSNTEHPRDTAPLSNVFKKFKAEGWHGEAKILRGGFAAFASRFPDDIREQQPMKGMPASKQPQSMSLNLASAAPVAGGCSLPDGSAAEPFFNNIRQNMDLVGGVGQMPLKLPDTLTPAHTQRLPLWLRNASAREDQGHDVSQKFLKIEERELHRMREALASNANYDQQKTSPRFRVAGIEKGSKNRYNDIYPFDHSRVRLQDVPAGHCDYINANYVKAELSNKSYIATQAPIPDTFDDFWRVVWEQDVRVIVALTAEVERGQVKCHAYWKSGDYGPFKVKVLGERRVYMDSKTTGSTSDARGSPLQRSSASGLKQETGGSYISGDEKPFINVRHFTLSHSSYPFQPIREITQLQYSYWPDFGTTSQPVHLLKLVEQCNKITRMSGGLSLNNDDAEPPGQRPLLVHCSAGCGRTGTFCTVDSVLDMLKQRQSKRHGDRSLKKTSAETDSNPAWGQDDTLDLVAKTVEDFRMQRPSMVQNLSQFVLCYESVLEWLVTHSGDN